MVSKLVPYIPIYLQFFVLELDWDLSPFSVLIVGDQEEGPPPSSKSRKFSLQDAMIDCSHILCLRNICNDSVICLIL